MTYVCYYMCYMKYDHAAMTWYDLCPPYVVRAILYYNKRSFERLRRRIVPLLDPVAPSQSAVTCELARCMYALGLTLTRTQQRSSH